MYNNSFNYLIDVFKGKSSINEPNWYEALGFLELNKVAGSFYMKSKKINTKLPNKIEKYLKAVFEKQKRRIEFLREYIKEISKSLIEGNVEHVFLKGSIFSNTDSKLAIYEDGMRNSNDIDILVKSDSIDKVSQVLRQLGFIQGWYDEENNNIIIYSRKEILTRRMNRGEVAPFIKLTDNVEIPFVEVDINFSLGNTPTDHIDLLNYMIDSRVLHHKDFDIYGLDNELFFIHLLMHQYKETTLLFMVKRNKDIELYKLLDLYYLQYLKTFSKTRFRELITKFKIKHKVALVLLQVAEVFNDNKLREYANKLRPEEEIVVDYENNKKYRFLSSIKLRIQTFDNVKNLVDYHDKPFYRWDYPIDYFRGPKC